MPLKKRRKFMKTAFNKWKKRRNSAMNYQHRKLPIVVQQKVTEDTARLMEKMQG